MRPLYKLSVLLVVFMISLLMSASYSLADNKDNKLIEPTRTLKEKPEARLTVLSEPPGMKVTLDGNKIGKTPVWSKEVKPGEYTLEVNKSETKIYVESGKTFRISLFKGTFVTIPEKEERQMEQLVQPYPAEQAPKKVERPRQLEQKQLSEWDLFLNGTLKHF